ncbi:class I adenylate-forming enzyme family protein [Halobacteriales archaeon Cl-PHB]
MTLSLARRADLWGDRQAVVDPGAGETLTYADLAADVETATGRLAAWGVDPGDRLVVLARNSPDVLALLFAARRRGATLAPVSFRLAPETVTNLFGRIDPDMVVAEPDFQDLVADADPEVVSLADFQGRHPEPDAAGASDAAPLFLHTGGTTGVPKVVPISERQLEWNAITESVAWGLDEETVTLTLLPMFHTGGWNLLTLPTLYSGGRVVLPAGFDPGQALELIEEYRPTQLFAVAAIYHALADHPDFAETDLSSLDWVMSGGGPCPEAVMEPYRERGIPFTQGYGLTEGGPNNLYVSPERDDIADKADRVGRPFPDCAARLVADGAVVDGEGTGELELRGPVTADGYLETADGTFEGGPASQARGTSAGRRSAGKWVSTGDVAHRDADGDYAIVGRTDNMFVSGGENVYPEEIEDALESHPAVDAAGVLAIPHERWGQVPMAVVVGDVDVTALEAYARDHLADFERPKSWTLVDDLPQTGAGKLDRDALRREYGQ